MNSVEQHREYSPPSLTFAVITASDSRSHSEDDSGRAIVELAVAAGHTVVMREIVRDEADTIRAAVEAALSRCRADVVVVSGGTGFAPRDVTLEAVMPILERVVEGFGELFRMLSFEQVGPAAMLSRALAGLVADSAVYLLPGSPQAVRLAMERLILPETAHLLGQARRDR